MDEKNWKLLVGSLVLGVVLFIGGFLLGRSAGSADLNIALEQYRTLRTADDALLEGLGSTLGGALQQSQRLAQSGGGLEQSARRVAILANAVHDAISAIARSEEARGSESPGSGQGGVKP